MKKIFRPKSIAIIGASSSKGKIGNILMNNLKSSTGKVKLFPVNPKRDTVMGLRSYSSVLDIESEIDLALIAVPAQFVAQTVKECAWHTFPIKNIVIISAGFSETGTEGKKREAEIKRLAEQHDLNIVGPNCLGVLNTHYRLNASFAKDNVPTGNIGLIAQSGALTTALFDLVGEHGLGFSLVSTLGNKVDVDENDLIELYAEDPKTEIIALYLEDIADGRRLAETISKVSPDKPVIIIKAGASKKTQKAIQSHTGAMAGDVEVTREAIKDNGGIVCDNFPDFIGTLKLLNGFKHPQNDKMVFVTNAGGPGVVATDLVEKQEGISLYSFTDKEKKSISKLLPEESSVENPVDVLGDAMDDRYKDVFDRCGKIKDIGSVCVIVTPQAQTPIAQIAEEIISANIKYNIPFIPIIMGGEAHRQAARILNKEGFSPFTFPVVAIKALALFIEYSKKRKQDRKSFKKTSPNKNNKLLKKLARENRNILLYNEARAIGKKARLNVLPARIVRDLRAAKKVKSGFPIVMKIDSPNVLHKNAKDGLALNILSNKEFLKAYKRLRRSFKSDQIIVQKQLEAGTELIIGIKKDPSFGHMLMLGLGGIFTEALDLKYLWMLPVKSSEILEKLENSPLEKILKKKKISITKVAKEAEKVGRIIQNNSYIKELDVNPIMMYPDKKPVIVDIKVIVDKSL